MTGTSTLQTVLISAGVTLTVGILSVLGAFLLERFKRRAADRRWLLERRHEAYVGFLEQANECLRAVNRSTVEKTEKSRAAARDEERSLASVWYSVLLVGTDQAQWLSGQAWRAAQDAVQHLFDARHPLPAAVAYRHWEAQLVTYLRAELQPRRNWQFWRRRTPAEVAAAASTALDAPRPER